MGAMPEFMRRRLASFCGMSEKLGPIQYGSGHTEVFLGREISDEQNYSEKTASLIDEEIHSIINNAYAVAEKVINEHRGKLESIAAFLIKNETMDEIQFKALMDNDPEPTIEALEAMMDEKRKKSMEENKAEELRIEQQKAEEERRRREEAAAHHHDHRDHHGDSDHGDTHADQKDDSHGDNNFFSDF